MRLDVVVVFYRLHATHHTARYIRIGFWHTSHYGASQFNITFDAGPMSTAYRSAKPLPHTFRIECRQTRPPRTPTANRNGDIDDDDDDSRGRPARNGFSALLRNIERVLHYRRRLRRRRRPVRPGGVEVGERGGGT